MTISLTGAERSLTEQIPPARRRVAIGVAIASILIGSAYGVARLRTTSCTWTEHRYQRASSDLMTTGDHLDRDAPLDAVPRLAVAAKTTWTADRSEPPATRGWCGSASGTLSFDDGGGAQSLRWQVHVYGSADALERGLNAVRGTGVPMPCAGASGTDCRAWARVVPLATSGCHLVLAAGLDAASPAGAGSPGNPGAADAPPPAGADPPAATVVTGLDGMLATVLGQRLAPLCRKW